MQKILFPVLFLTIFIFAQEFVYEQEDIYNNMDENIEEAIIDSVLITKPKKQKVQPIINLDQRNLSVSVPNAPNMSITIFTPKGKKILNKKIVGETANIALPKSAKGTIIITIDANRNYYSQRISID